MALAEELVLEIRARTDNIRRSLSDVQQGARRTADSVKRSFAQSAQRIEAGFQRAAERIEAGFLRVRAAATVAAQRIQAGFQRVRGAATVAIGAAAAFGVLATQAFAAGEAISDLSQRAGVSAETLQELQFAANNSGASARDLNDGLSRLNRRLGLFLTNGGGPAAQAFEQLGLSTRIASGELRTAEQVFDAAVASLESVESTAERAAIASQLFGEDSGPRLAALLARGTEGISELREQAQELGAVLSDADTARLAEASDALERLGTRVQVAFLEAFAENADDIVLTAEALADVAVAFANNVTQLSRLKNELKALADNPIIQGLGFVNRGARAVVTLGASEAGTVGNLVSGLGPDAPQNPVNEQASPRVGGVMTQARSRIDQTTDSAEQLQEVLSNTGGTLSNVGATMERFGDLAPIAFEEAAEGAENMAETLERLENGALKSLEAAFVDFAVTGEASIGRLIDSLKRLIAQLAFEQFLEGPIRNAFSSAFSGGSPSAPAAPSGASAASVPAAAGAAPMTIAIDARGAEAGVENKIRAVLQEVAPAIQAGAVRESILTLTEINRDANAL